VSKAKPPVDWRDITDGADACRPDELESNYVWLICIETMVVTRQLDYQLNARLLALRSSLNNL
jgi:hypothetical protein